MKVHIVLAHPEPHSYNAHLADVARAEFERNGHSVTVSDLYAKDFDPCEGARHYATRVSLDRFDVQLEQRNASDEGTIPEDVMAEIRRLDDADVLILQYPMWWHLPPAILKGWMDRVFIYGEVYASRTRFENGRFKGKKAMISVTVGTSENTYAYNGRSGDIDLLLWPVNFSLAYVGYDVMQPFVAYGVEAGLRYSSSEEVEKRLANISEDLRAAVANIDVRETIPFNRMEEWGADGLMKPDAPALSPFIRRRKELDLG